MPATARDVPPWVLRSGHGLGDAHPKTEGNNDEASGGKNEKDGSSSSNNNNNNRNSSSGNDRTNINDTTRNIDGNINNVNSSASGSDNHTSQFTEKELDPPLQPPPIASPRERLVRRVSRDGFEAWVHPDHARASKLPNLLRKRADKPGRRWDHLRSSEPLIQGLGYRAPGEDRYAPWRDMILSQRHGRIHSGDSQVVEYDVLNDLQPGFNSPIKLPPLPAHKTARKVSRFFDFILRHPAAQLFPRVIVLSTTIAALAVASSILRHEKSEALEGGSSASELSEVAQATLAICVDAITIPYIIYMTCDDFMGKPLGLRSPVPKISLALLDLFFIIFKSASTALAFQALVFRDSGVWVESGTFHLAEALAPLLLVSLMAWVCNFTINIFRIVERLGGINDDAPQLDNRKSIGD